MSIRLPSRQADFLLPAEEGRAGSSALSLIEIF
jgi:hypothetical protein